MTPALRLAAWTLAACVAAVAYVEDGVVAAMQQPHRVQVSAPSPLCLALERGRWRTWAHAQQADGGGWTIACSYHDSRLYVP